MPSPTPTGRRCSSAPIIMPAHIAAEQGGMSADGQRHGTHRRHHQERHGRADARSATFWSTGWDYQPDLPQLPDVALLPTSGPYKYDNGSNGTLTVVKNDKWWGTPGKTNSFVFKFVSPEEWVQAMANGEIDQYDPSNPSQDTVSQLDALGATVTVRGGRGLHLQPPGLRLLAAGQARRHQDPAGVPQVHPASGAGRQVRQDRSTRTRRS